MGIPVFDELDHRVPRIVVEGDCGTEHPHDASVFFLVAEKLVEPVVVAGIGRFAGPARTESEGIVVRFDGFEAVDMDKDSVRRILGAAEDDPVADLETAEFGDADGRLIDEYGHAVHARLLRKNPCAADLEILGENGHGMEIFRRHSRLDDDFRPYIRCLAEPLL